MANLKIAIISHALVVPVNRQRWLKLSMEKNAEVHLLIPQYWESYWFGNDEQIVFEPEEIHDNNFHVHPLPTTNCHNWGKYLFKSLDIKFRQIKPDLIYIIHEESILIHHQIYLCRKLFAPQAKIIFFSMNASGIPYQKAQNPIKKIIHKFMWQNIKRNTDAALVHYPGCLDSLHSGYYSKPVYLQTQVGVDETLFSPDSKIRQEYRAKIGFEGRLVIGYTGRLVVDKGVDDLVAAFIKLAREFPQLALLLVGNGALRDEIAALGRQHGVTDRIHITGFVDQAEVPHYMNAMDIFVLGSKTMPHWIDTFPLVTVQAQSVGIPVIASDSGAIPWQLGDSAIIFPEGDRERLEQSILTLIADVELRKHYAVTGRQRSHQYFCHTGMNQNFLKIVELVMSGEFVFHEPGEAYTQWKAY